MGRGRTVAEVAREYGIEATEAQRLLRSLGASVSAPGDILYASAERRARKAFADLRSARGEGPAQILSTERGSAPNTAVRRKFAQRATPPAPPPTETTKVPTEQPRPAADQHLSGIELERDRESRYNREYQERFRITRASVQASTWNTLTTRNPVAKPKHPAYFVGKVTLGTARAELNGRNTFYIGKAHHTIDGFEVFGWSSRVACTFYQRPNGHHDWCNDVAAVEHFARENGVIEGIDDESSIRVSTLPSEELHPTPGVVQDLPRSSIPLLGTASAHAPQSKIEVRAAHLLLNELKKPKQTTMSSVLATLQPDQYEAITQPANNNHIVQGHPGTGKTIVATHRIAYLLSPDSDAVLEPGLKPLLVGPTEEHIRFARGAIDSLADDPGRYVVKSLPTLLAEVARFNPNERRAVVTTLESSGIELVDQIDAAAAAVRASRAPGARVQPSEIYSALLRGFAQKEAAVEWVRFGSQLPQSWLLLDSLGSSDLLGLAAYVALSARVPRGFSHIVVDEAQDLLPIEWAVLRRLGNIGGWTLVGDMNQRRSDYAWGSWDRVASQLGIRHEVTAQAPVQVLERGYRSTLPIMNFANQLLPARERYSRSLVREGAIPKVVKVSNQRQMPLQVAKAAQDLLIEVIRTGGGSTAIIALERRPVESALEAAGWWRDRVESSLWRKREMQLWVLTPERARGLEFDGVLVVEPSDFPSNLGRNGVLYTALTRANRLLTVIRSKPLPGEMKDRL